MPMLEQAQRVANERGLEWRLIQAQAEATGLPDASFDLVASYIVLHEVPAAATRALFAEAFRLLEPGGNVLMSDVRPYRDMNKTEEWRAEYLAIHGGEPYWREAARLDLAEVARDCGFVEAKSYGLGDMHYPWVTIATKPGAS
jgi:ubiquinone/menaquinone biosynthesis C-methylase UbiE